LRQVALVQNTGIGVNNLLPVRMVSEPVQLAIVTRRHGVPFPTALATLVAGNVLDIFASALLIGLGILLVPGLREGKVSIQLVGALILFVISLLVFIVVARGLDAIPLAKRVRFFQQLTIAVGLLREMPGRLWLSFFGTMGHWFFVGLAGWIIASALGIDVGLLTMIAILVAATFFISVVPSLPGGAGTYHFAVVSMMTAVGADPEVAFSFAVVMHLIIVLPPSVLAVWVMWKVGLGAILKSGGATLGSKLSPVPAGAAPDRLAR
ncbi:MAG: flippase-like domain-containing protein, partial [Chloroflexi bacterium]|nr:flippase-like domain-containing protein [Chloroflexota bacterium]